MKKTYMPTTQRPYGPTTTAIPLNADYRTLNTFFGNGKVDYVSTQINKGIDNIIEKIETSPTIQKMYITSTKVGDFLMQPFYLSSGRRKKEKQEKEKKRLQKQQAKEEKMKGGGSSDYAKKTQDGNADFWEKNPHRQKVPKEPKPSRSFWDTW